MIEPIVNSKDLSSFCESIENKAENEDIFITVDTEFIRENTYWPRVCLIQIAIDTTAVAIDPLAPNMDLAPLFKLMQNPRILKVFHAARQDMEIFWHLNGALPAPIFDTQVAAMVCGYGESVGYESLVSSLTGQSLDKSSRYTDWSRRPLTPKQLDYALADVILLQDVYLHLQRMLEEKGRATWIHEEMAKFSQVSTYEVIPEEAWKKIKQRSTKPRFLAILQALAKVREVEARQADVPRARIMKDEVLLELAVQAPLDAEGLERIRGIPQGFSKNRIGGMMLKAITEARQLPLDQCPKVVEEIPFPPRFEPLLDLLKMFLKICAETHHVAQKLIASRQELEHLALYGLGQLDLNAPNAVEPLLSGWRYDSFAKEALALIKGEIALAWRGRRVTFISFPSKE